MLLTMTKAVEDVLSKHFIQTKVDIAYAINKPFPFFEALRDHHFITEEMYKDSQEACDNLLPVPRVVYNVLKGLEQTFHPSLLLTFNLSEYPSLGAVFRSFENVVTAYEENKRSPQTLPPPQPSPPNHLSSSPRVGEPQAGSLQINEIRHEHPSPSHPAEPPPGFIQEGKTTPGVPSTGQGVQKKLKVVNQRTQRKNDSTRNLKMVTRSQKTRTGHAQISKAQGKATVGPAIGKAQDGRVP
ncbi:sp110 nuclear body protein-like [Microtus ochrogaster]|uniref:Sp110 nuclear body protein-like n=1 Tax=Microtus ochrogaster TaxID=79684 RepID=A0ABM1UJX1_MICOH|nr:sp110 nuclear body protein-like [Microtus ochrogaster]